MSGIPTGRMRHRIHRDYSIDLLVLQIELISESDTLKGTFWRDAKIEDVTLADRLPVGAIRERSPGGVTYLPD